MKKMNSGPLDRRGAGPVDDDGVGNALWRPTIGAMAKILYAGTTLALPDNVDVDELASVLLDTYAKGAYSWVAFDSTGEPQQQVRLLTGPGIPIGFVSDHTDGRDEVASKESASDSGR